VPNYLTPEGARKLAEELQKLAAVERPRVVSEVSDAAAQGDRSENAEYIYGKKRLREIDRRIRFLQKRLDAAVVVKSGEVAQGEVRFGALVDVRDENGKASRYRIVKCCEDSLRRLRTDRIDLYQIHMQDITVPEEETLRALDDLVRAGKVLYLGCSNYAAYRLMNSLWLSRHNRWASYVTLQAQYSLLVRDLEREHVPLCREEGLGILPWSPLAGGFLTGKFERDKPPAGGTRLGEKAERFERFNLDRNWRILDAVRAVAAEVGGTPSAVSLAWLLAKPQVTSVIFGARTLEQLDANLAAVGLELGAPHLEMLDKASAFDLGYPYAFIGMTQSSW